MHRDPSMDPDASRLPRPLFVGRLARRRGLERPSKMPRRTYRFEMTFVVDDEHEGWDDPEWVADAAWGALTNGYGIESWFGECVLVVEEAD